MPAKREGPTLKQVTRQVLEELDGPAPVDVGAELEYLYDFGDCLRHTLVLESIGEKERGVTYPRVVR